MVFRAGDTLRFRMWIPDWHAPTSLPPRRYVCGYCGDRVGPDRGYFGNLSTPGGEGTVYVYICSYCGSPTYFDEGGRQWPGAASGAPVAALPTDVEAIYEEARRCTATAAPNTAVMACRK